MSEKLYLLGHPINHSKSPVMYNAVYELLHLPWTYELADKSTKEEAQVFLEARDYLSLNITTPYKPLALRASTHQAASAKLARGANLLVVKNEALIAFNTDGQGCVSFLEHAGFHFADSSVVVCGTGPTALAITHFCAIAGAREVVVIGRDKHRAQRVLSAYVKRFDTLSSAALDLPPAQKHHRSFREAYEQTIFKYGSYKTSTQAISRANLVINATTLGMQANDDSPFDPSFFRACQTVFDTVYGHGETAFLSEARAAGASVYDGSGMLIAQAIESLKTIIDIAEVEVNFDERHLFSAMSKAAGFTFSEQ